MDETIIERWNRKVTPLDTVYHLGDVGFFKNEEAASKILYRLNGAIHLIHGNHDRDYIKNHERFTSSNTYLSTKINDVLVVMFHFPIYEWDRVHYGAWHLYGHVHGKPLNIPSDRCVDVCVENHNYEPWSYEELFNTPL
jgi:calcineurin-like phosphoesterase family protein